MSTHQRRPTTEEPTENFTSHFGWADRMKTRYIWPHLEDRLWPDADVLDVEPTVDGGVR